MSGRVDPRIAALTGILQLGQEARRAETLEAFAFVVVNSLFRLIGHRIAVLWADRPGRTGVVAMSGLAQVDADAEPVQWLDKVCGYLNRTGGDENSIIVQPEQLKERMTIEWGEWLPHHVLWLPLRHPSRRVPLGGLWIARDQEFSAVETAMLEQLSDAFAESLSRHLNWRRTRTALLGFVSRRPLMVVLALALTAAIPVPMSVTAPAEIAAKDPIVVAAPRDGVVSRFQVKPNEVVTAGQLLFELDDVEVRNRHRLAQRDVAISEAEYKRAKQAAFSDAQSSADLGILATRVERARAETAYAAELLERSQVKAEQDGIVIFSDPSDWIGRPVKTGERIATLANPDKVELVAWLSTTDAIALEPGAGMSMALNVAPTSPLQATLVAASYEAIMSPAGVLSFRLKGNLDIAEAPPRIGLRGNARIYADRVPLIAWILRKPLAVMRQKIGI